MQQVRVAARRKYTPEEKVRIVLEEFRREVAVNGLCRREGIKPGAGGKGQDSVLCNASPNLNDIAPTDNYQTAAS